MQNMTKGACRCRVITLRDYEGEKNDHNPGNCAIAFHLPRESFFFIILTVGEPA